MSESDESLTRREVFRRGAMLAALPLANAAEVLPDTRAEEAHRVRVAAAALQNEQRSEAAKANGDEDELPRYTAMYSKGLPHNALGEVHPEAYALLLRALRSGSPRDFDFIPRIGEVKLTNPQAGFTYNLIGPDPSAVACRPAPRFAGAEQAAEMAELYWQALVRDVPFAGYESDRTIARAAEELGRMRGVRTTASNIFRGPDPGSLAGPYISQFLWKEIFYSPLPIVQKIRPAVRRDHLHDYDRWLDLQNGIPPGALVLDDVPCYVRNGRDLAEYVHRDFSYQAPLSAGLILLKMNAPPNRGNPYTGSRGQMGFTTFGGPYLLYLIATVTHAALTACWYQKWNVHRRLRPEEFGGRIANHLAKRAQYPLHESLLDSEALSATRRIQQGSALLTSSYPEAAPTHPAYPAGHAVIAGAGTTVLKAFFDETYVLPEPVVCSADGLSLKRYDGPPLTLRGEADKLAANIGMGRCFAGIHWRSDVEEGIRLGEEVAIRVLRELQLTSREPFAGFRFHRVDGTPVTA